MEHYGNGETIQAANLVSEIMVAISTSPSPTGSDAPLEVLGLNGATITGIALGKYSTVILTNQGTVLQWGDSSYEPLGFSVPVQVADLQAVPPPAISPMAGSYTNSPNNKHLEHFNRNDSLHLGWDHAHGQFTRL